MHIGGFGEASFGLRGQEAGKLFAWCQICN